MWFAFMTLIKTFYVMDALLIPNNYAMTAWVIVTIATLCIGFGYSMFLISLVERRIPRRKTFTITLASAIAVFLLFCAEFAVEVATHTPHLTNMYMSFDMFMRNHYGVVFAWMDFGNTQLLVASMFWWVLTGSILLRVHLARRSRV